MLLSTPSFVLHTTKYSETSVIAKVFTRQLGVRSYILKGVRSANGRVKQNLLQPLSYLDMTVYNNPKKQLQYVKEIRPMKQWATIPSDFIKSSLIFFVAEALYKSLREEEPLPDVFDFVVEMLESVDEDSITLPDFPLLFLLRFSTFLGISPLNNFSRQEPLFNLKEGRYLAPPSFYSLKMGADVDYFLDETSSMYLHYYLDSVFSDAPCPLLGLEVRTKLINILLEYYRIHLTDFRNFKSHEILHTVLQ